MVIKPIYKTDSTRIQEYVPLSDPDYKTFTVTVSQYKDFMEDDNWLPATVSYPSSRLSNEQVLELAAALTAAAQLAMEWTNNPPKGK